MDGGLVGCRAGVAEGRDVADSDGSDELAADGRFQLVTCRRMEGIVCLLQMLQSSTGSGSSALGAEDRQSDGRPCRLHGYTTLQGDALCS